MKAAGTFAIQVKEPLFLVMDNFNMIDWEKELRKEIGENGKP
jgi:hypothetical protein